MRQGPSRIVVWIAALGLLAGAACGGNDDAPTAAEDEEAARRIVLTSADLPGFTREPAEEDDPAGPLDRCVNNNPLFVGDNPRGVDGDDFTKDDGNLRVQSGAVFAVNESEATKGFADLEGALASQCLRDAMRETLRTSLDPGVTVRDVSNAPLAAPNVADQSAASRLTVELEAARERASVIVDLTVLRDGRVVGGVFTFGFQEPFPEAERIRLTRLVGERMTGEAKNTPDVGPPPTAAATTVASPVTSSDAGGYTRFRDPSGVSLEHPRSWTVEPSGGTDPLFLFIDPPTGVQFPRSVNVLVQTSPSRITLDEYTDLSTRQIRALPGSAISESRPTTLSGQPAHRITYRANFDGQERRVLSVWTIRGGNKAWLVTYTADPARFDATLPEIERLLGTVQVPA